MYSHIKYTWGDGVGLGAAAAHSIPRLSLFCSFWFGVVIVGVDVVVVGVVIVVVGVGSGDCVALLTFIIASSNILLRSRGSCACSRRGSMFL